MSGQVGRDVLVTLADPHVLIATDVRDHLDATEKSGGSIDKSRRARERIRHESVNPDSGLLGLEGRQ